MKDTRYETWRGASALCQLFFPKLQRWPLSEGSFPGGHGGTAHAL